MSDEGMDVPAFLRALPIGAVFTQGDPRKQPDCWIKTERDSYRRAHDWARLTADDFKAWTLVVLFPPLDCSIDQDEVDRREAGARNKSRPCEVGR